jgi:DNA polymerase
MNKQLALKQIALEISKCRKCRVGKIGNPVPGEGNADARVVFVGEAPGKNEAREGRPFIGRSGKLLRRLIVDSGMVENEVFITSPVKYLPKRGAPSQADIRHGLVHFSKQLAVISPDIIVLLGKTACKAVLGRDVAILSQRGKVIEEKGRKIFITLHPAAVIRFPGKYMKLFQLDFGKLKKLINS